MVFLALMYVVDREPPSIRAPAASRSSAPASDSDAAAGFRFAGGEDHARIARLSMSVPVTPAGVERLVPGRRSTKPAAPRGTWGRAHSLCCAATYADLRQRRSWSARARRWCRPFAEFRMPLYFEFPASHAARRHQHDRDARGQRALRLVARRRSMSGPSREHRSRHTTTRISCRSR